MAIEALEVRMARLEGAYEQSNERLGGVEREIAAFRMDLKSEVAGLRTELKTEIAGVRSDIAGLRSDLSSAVDGLRAQLISETGKLGSADAETRRQMQTQFYWTLTLILTAILLPFLQNIFLTR